jgi:hypothetical protein
MIGWLAGVAVAGTAAGAFLVTGIIPLAILSGPLRARWRQHRIDEARRRVVDAASKLGCGDPGCARCEPTRT